MRPLRGRSTELKVLTELLHTRVADAGVALVEGPAGSGRSRLLAEAERIGRRHQLGLVRVGGDRASDQAAVAPLVSATAYTGASDAVDPPAPGHRLPVHLEGLRRRIGEMSRRNRSLIVFDDLHRADPALLLALQDLVHEFAERPLTWVLARRADSSADSGDAASDVFDRLAAAGARRLVLHPLASADLRRIAGDVFGCTSLDGRLAEHAEAVDGNPALLLGLLIGLLEEDRVRVRDGVAGLVDGEDNVGSRLSRWSLPVPEGFRRLVAGMLHELGPETRRLIEVGAVLGISFAPDDAAEIMGTTAAALLSAVREALRARILAAAVDDLTFRSEAVRQAILQGIPAPLRPALHRQYAAVLAERGRPASEIAVHLARGARPGDRAAIGVLRAAAERMVTSNAATAAELGLRALHLTGEDEPDRVAVAGTAARALVRVGPLAQVVELGEAMARRITGGPPSEELRAAVAVAHLLQGRPDRALAEGGDPGEEGELGRVLLSALSHVDPVTSERRARALIDDPAVDQITRDHAQTCLARARWHAGDIEAALVLAKASAAASSAWFDPPLLLVAALLIRVGELEESRSALETAHHQLRVDGAAVLGGAPDLVRSSLELAAGRPAAAIAAATAGLAAVPGCEPTGLAAPARRSLAVAALRAGDLATATEQLEQLEQLVPGGPAACWLRVQVVAAQPDGAALTHQLLGVCRDPHLLRAVVLDDETAAPWLVRHAAQELPAAVLQVLDAVDELCATNPGVEVATAAAFHAHGLAGDDVHRVALAEQAYRDIWSAASAAEDLGRLSAADRERAIAHLDRALKRYEACNATRDAARVRQRLRRLGVQRRHWNTEQRPAIGWGSLTSTERRVAELVASGLTNRQVAHSMYLSPHTVGFHLRQIYRKLEVRSRVELAAQSRRRS